MVGSRGRDQGQSCEKLQNLLPTIHRRVLICVLKKKVTGDNFFNSPHLPNERLERNTGARRSCEKDGNSYHPRVWRCSDTFCQCGSHLRQCSEIHADRKTVCEGQGGSRGGKVSRRPSHVTVGPREVQDRRRSVRTVSQWWMAATLCNVCSLVAVYACFMHYI